jgi:hypothetical protein
LRRDVRALFARLGKDAGLGSLIKPSRSQGLNPRKLVQYSAAGPT